LRVTDKNSFYEGKALKEVEWWISYACRFPELYWGRLRVFSDGSADACFSKSKIYGFANRDSAENFLTEDEYTRLTNVKSNLKDGLLLFEPKRLVGRIRDVRDVFEHRQMRLGMR